MDPRDRRTALLNSTSLNGIDFVEICNDAQTSLRVHFLNGVPLATPLPPPTITGGETISTVAIQAIVDSQDWGSDGNHLTLSLTVATPGDFSNYVLQLQSPQLDPFLDQATFSFKARCPSDLDCEAAAPACPAVTTDVPPIDYLAKDFLSFRQALLDFSALRYPEWQERSEADFGMMFLEALSALADDLSYTQDRIATEAALATATQRRSVVRLARLIDYEPQPVTSATVMLQFDVAPGVTTLDDGLVVTAVGPDGIPVPFETGSSLNNRLLDPSTGVRRPAQTTQPVSPIWNRGRIQPYWPDDSERCLPAGATAMYVLGQGYGFTSGQPLLIETAGATSADPPVRQIVHLTGPGDTLYDPLFLRPADQPGASPQLTWENTPPTALAATALTRISWDPDDRLLVARDLTKTTLAGNLLSATQGATLKATATAVPAQTVSESFAIPTPPTAFPALPLAIVRTGANDTPATPSLQYLYSLSNTPVTWLQPDDPDDDPLPEIIVETRGSPDADRQWGFVRRLLDAGAFDNAFTLDAARYSQVGQSVDGSVSYFDYDGDGGDTIRFGDGIFGGVPPDGTVFDVTYRLGAGAGGNVAADTVTRIDPSQAATILAVTNPQPAAGGTDAETLDRVARVAPEKFRAVQYRALRPEDYESAAQTLPWVQRASTVFRWTGSWLTVFTTTDPLDSEQIAPAQQTELIDLLNRSRMAGYESYVPPAQYVSLDLVVEVCAQASAFRGNVQTAVLAALNPGGTGQGTTGFFNPDNFTFGQSLERSALEAAIQAASGVAGVTSLQLRVRNRNGTLSEMPDVVAVAPNEILRCDNDPSFAEHGSIKVTVKGGK